MSTPADRAALAEWVRATLAQLEQTSGPPPWADASSDNEEN